MKKLLSIFALTASVFSANVFANNIQLGEKLIKFNNNNLNLKYGAEFYIDYMNKVNELSDFKLNLNSALYDRNSQTSIKKYSVMGILSTQTSIFNNAKFYIGIKRTSVKVEETVNKYSYLMGLNINRGSCNLNINYIYTPNIEGDTGLNQANLIATMKRNKVTVTNALTLQRFTNDETIFKKKNFVSDIVKVNYKLNDIFEVGVKGKIGEGIYKINPYTNNINILSIKEKYGFGANANIFITKNVKFNLGLDYNRNDDGKKTFNSYDLIANLNFKF